jgi:hypothetical protein
MVAFIMLFSIGGACLLFFQAKKEWEKKNVYAMATLIGFGVIVIGVVAFYSWISGGIPLQSEDPDAWQTKNNRTMAYVMMQDFVKRQLKSPGSAKFEWISEPACTIEKDGFEYRISSWVDSQNSFGALIRTRFSGVVRQVDKDNWELVSLIKFLLV